MPCILLPIDALRPTIEIGIAFPASLVPAGSARPAITWIPAIADTGCSHTSLHGDVCAAAGLNVIGKGITHTANGPVNCNRYLGDMFIKVPFPNGTVFEYPFRDRMFVQLMQKIPQFDALLGMDIFTMGTLHINGHTKNATFCW